MIQRFHIEDLIAQDASGVVFRAWDQETGQTVALRRFFPFGAAGGGLQADEQAAYQIAVERLAGLRHVALRSVIGGACDPIDGMPYLVTEWVEGKSLQEYLAGGALLAQDAIELIDQALEVSELLSQVLVEEAVWVETRLQSIVVGDESSGRRFTFWICPLKWLGSNEKSRGLGAVLTLAGQVMGWKGRRVQDQAGQGLGGWINRLRCMGANTSLSQAREMLASAVAAPAAAVAADLTEQARHPQPEVVAPRASRMPLWINISLVLLAVGLGGWLLLLQRARQTALQAPAKVSPVSRWVIAKPPPAGAAARGRAMGPEQAAILAEQRADAEKNQGVIVWLYRELLLQSEGKEVVIEGVLQRIDASDNATLYLLFTPQAEDKAVRVAVPRKPAVKELSNEALTPLRGKTIRVKGKVMISKGVPARPEIQIGERAAIEEMK
jgi:hypothetical protein